MTDHRQFLIDGRWVDPIEPRSIEVVNPATEAAIGRVSLGAPADVDRAVAAAKAAFGAWSATSKDERIEILESVTARYRDRLGDLAAVISVEMGAPIGLATSAQAPSGLVHLANSIEALRRFEFTERRGTSLIIREPIGVCGLITPWNWPANQIMCKVAPALAAGCTMVLKPSDFTPFSAVIIAEILVAAGLPAGVFNLVNGDGPGVGAAIAAHPEVDMVSFTGSTRGGIAVAKAAADTVKRVCQELGGKSADIILADADLPTAVEHGVRTCMRNSGQSCNAPTRMFVPRDHHDEACAAARSAVAALRVGDPSDPATDLGPLANRAQWEKVQALIQIGIDEGAELICGGLGRPEGSDVGAFVRPTVFGNVDNEMTIAREEIFGPVLAILPYDSEDEAVELANDTEYGLSGYVQSGNLDHAIAVGSRLRTGQVHLNGAPADFAAPFGGYKRSGNGREWGLEGMEEFLEVKVLMGASR